MIHSFILYLLSIGIALFLMKSMKFESSSSGHSVCGRDQFFSEYSSKCEQALLQAGEGETITTLSVTDLRTRFREKVFTLQNPSYEKDGTADKSRKYRGILLGDLVAWLLPAGADIKDYVLAATCLDGFDPVLDLGQLGKVKNAEGMLVYEQAEITDAKSGVSKDGKWELVPAEWGIVSPGPFYILWSKADGTFPLAWPFQVTSVRLLKASDYKSMINRLQPAMDQMGKSPKTAVEEGFAQFRGKCLTCHQIDGVGGRKARVDLKAVFHSFPSANEAREFLKALVKNPPAGMSEIKGMKLTDEDTDRIAAYLLHMSGR